MSSQIVKCDKNKCLKSTNSSKNVVTTLASLLSVVSEMYVQWTSFSIMYTDSNQCKNENKGCCILIQKTSKCGMVGVAHIMIYVIDSYESARRPLHANIAMHVGNFIHYYK